MIVVDASVAVKWFLPEDGSEAAFELLKGKEILIAPDLIRVEVSNAFMRRARKGDITHAEAKEAMGMWLDALKQGVVQIQGNLEDLRDATNFALQLGHAVHDCYYLAVARRTSSKLVTADKAFAAKAISVFPVVEMLSLERPSALCI
ncbi:MAG: type II toxin-antitoxin system VapC family toxin [Candidatus Solibacter usitatus]|nr:type II toxin-antitoxin system VapC family toxin [Candidatus Solibacter usitatus]